VTNDDTTRPPITYRDAGVDTAEGARAVDAIRESVRSTYRREVIGDIGGFGGLFSIAAAKDMDDPVLVRDYLKSLPGISDVHDLHIWGMSTTDTALTAHLVMPHGYPGDSVLAGVTERLRHQFNICHATIQVETDASHACALAPDHVV
jgi:hypothetical protein